MKNWVYTCKNFQKVRKLIKEGEETSQNCLLILKEIQNLCDELASLNLRNWLFHGSFKDLKTEIQEDMELMNTNDYEECKDNTDYYLREFYDLCDISCIWLGI